jgi:hypothetical protein
VSHRAGRQRACGLRWSPCEYGEFERAIRLAANHGVMAHSSPRELSWLVSSGRELERWAAAYSVSRVEMFLSVVQRKMLARNDFSDLAGSTRHCWPLAAATKRSLSHLG